MKFLLVNANVAVEKIFKLAAKKASINLDTAKSIAEITINEDYNCIFIDDALLNTGDFRQLKRKMIATKFCLILSKDKAMPSGFDGCIRKPFLPTDIYNVLKKEKQGGSMGGGGQQNSGAKGGFAAQNAAKSAPAQEISNINDIDLSEFSDSEDEFLTGVKDTSPIDISGLEAGHNAKNPESSEEDLDLGLDFDADLSFDLPDESAPEPSEDDDLGNFGESLGENDEINFTYDDEDSPKPTPQGRVPIPPKTQPKQPQPPAQKVAKNDAPIALKDEADVGLDDEAMEFDLSDNDLGDTIDLKPSQDAPPQKTAEQKSPPPLRPRPKVEDEIDFAAAFALQDELLQAQEKSKAKRLVGGDIYKKKEPAPPKPQPSTPPPQAKPAQAPQEPKLEPKTGIKAEPKVEPKPKPAPPKPQPKPAPPPKAKQDEEDSFSFDDLDFDEIDAPKDAKPANAQSPQAQDSGELDFLEDSEVDFGDLDGSEAAILEAAPQQKPAQEPKKRSINEFSDEELDSLDDDELLKLQEEYLQNGNGDFLEEDGGFEPHAGGEISDELDEVEPLDEIEEELEPPLEQGNEPRVLNKDDISEVVSMLDETSAPVRIRSNELGSITQEALSEVLEEGDFGDFDTAAEDSQVSAHHDLPQDLAQDSAQDDQATLEPHAPQNLAQSPTQGLEQDFEADLPQDSMLAAQQIPQNMQALQATQTPPKNTAITLNNGTSIDIADILKTFPIDKLRELLSGVQITINITFPSKKQ